VPRFPLLASRRTPITQVSHADATAFASWAGKRLPTSTEWQRAAQGRFGLSTTGEGNGFGLGGFGLVWEWTSTSSGRNGFVVCGGRWRDRTFIEPEVT
jgi:formylglycine-generating enzyme required for sulfatase activity